MKLGSVLEISYPESAPRDSFHSSPAQAPTDTFRVPIQCHNTPLGSHNFRPKNAGSYHDPVG